MTLSEEVINWTKKYLNSFGGKTKAVIGISGGKDSTIAAKICVEAVGRDRVILVRMPQGSQHDLNVAKEVCDYLGCQSYEINIKDVCEDLSEIIFKSTKLFTLSNSVYASNTPARIRMTILYGLAALVGDARVVNTCNFSERYIGYETKFGDSAGDFSPLGNLLVREVKQIGRELGIPDKFINKKPEDGLSGKTDEDNLGFTYEALDSYIACERSGVFLEDINDVNYRILKMHESSKHKIEEMPTFKT